MNPIPEPEIPPAPRKPRRLVARLARWMAALIVLFLLGYYALPWAMPFPSALLTPPPSGLEITDRNGKSLRRLLANGQRSLGSIPLDQIPQALKNATLAAEDKRFYSHGGIDFLSLGRAIRDAVQQRRSTSGASTITQQLVKITNPRPRTLKTKVLEMLTARRLEMTWSKDQILEAYLNRLDYGNLRVGCAVAAQGYFSKPLRDCSTAECALLAGLPQAPTRLNPYTHLDRTLRRQGYVLKRMDEAGMISSEERNRASSETIHVRHDFGDFFAPHFVDLVLASAPVAERIETSLDLPLQQFCERMVVDRLDRIKQNNVQQAACVVIDNATGAIRAMVGSRDFADSKQGQVNGAVASRSPGSALKPFTYLLAFQQGDSPASIIPDLPIEYSTPNGLYKPKNYSGRTYGPVSYRLALANSLNLAAVRVLDRAGGAEALIAALQSCGISTLTRSVTDYGLGLTIGGGEVTLLELTNAYATLARQGLHLPATFLNQPVAEDAAVRLFNPVSCYLLADVMADNDARTRSFGTRSPLRLPFPVAVKTGTSTDYRDNWTVGFTPQYTVGVWVGNFDGTRMHSVSGVTGAGPLFRDIFTYLDARERQSWYAMPDSVSVVPVDSLTGLPIPEEWKATRPAVEEKFHRDSLPAPSLPEQYDARGRVALPKNYADWLASPDNWLGDQVVLAPVTSKLNVPELTLRIITPLSGSTYLLDPDLPDQGRFLVLRSNQPPEEVRWKSDSLKITQSDGRSVVELVPGMHQLEVTDAKTGSTKISKIEVRRL